MKAAHPVLQGDKTQKADRKRTSAVKESKPMSDRVKRLYIDSDED